ncbi:MAG: CbiX/SirB N-terminal domain-containing protein [Pseudomonadota bacterium]
MSNPHTDTSHKHLIIIAHGSRRETSNEYFMELSHQLGSALQGQYQEIHGCFLEMAQPKLMERVEQAVSQGAQQIDVFPYFLGPGNHVLADIPELLEQAQATYPDCRFVQLTYFGASPAMTELIAQSISAQTQA